MLKTPEEQKLEDDSNKYFYMNKVIDNIKVKQQNGRLWTPYHDMQLYEYVIKYKFNFYEISNAFQRLCTNDKKYEYSEDAVRLHWAFLHAMRHFDQTPDEAYYQRMKLQYDKEKPKTFKKRVEEKEKEKLSEEEDIKRMKEEFEKMMKEKYDKENEDKKNDDSNINDTIKTKVELDKKEQEEVEELINETKRKKEEENIDKKNNNNEKEKEKEIKEEKNNSENKDKKNLEEKKDNKLYDENDEPEYIKQLFNKTIPPEILDKLNKDQGKYNSSPEKEKDKSISSSNNIKQEAPINPQSFNQNLQNSPNKEIISTSNNKTNTENEEEDLFPIKSSKQKEISEPGKFENINMEKELQNTQDFHDYIESNPELKKQYDQLNNYCNFAVKSINYLVNKSTGLNDTSSEEAKKIEQTNKQLNELLLEPIIKETKEKGYTLEDWNKKIEEEENKMTFETTNYDNYMKNAPKDEDRDIKLNKFKEHLFSFAEKISTEELLEKITGIINQNNSNENDNNENNINNNEGNNNVNNNEININNIQNINANNNINNNINLENAVQNFMNNLENNNNNVEDEKSEFTKEQSESVNENLTENNGRNTISSVGSLEFPKKYRHVYRGVVYYDEKPNPNDKNKKNNKNKKKIQEDDEIEEDDDEDEDEYNK